MHFDPVKNQVSQFFYSSVLRLLRHRFDSLVRPIQYFNVHPALIRSVVFVKIPPFSKHHDGKFDLEAEPTMLITCSYDGLVKLVNLDNPLNSAEIMKERSKHFYRI